MYYINEKSFSAEEAIKEVKQFHSSIDKTSRCREHTILELIGKPIGNKKILDYGCGLGYISLNAEKRNWDVTGIDLSQNEVEICNLMKVELGSSVNFEHKAISELSDASFDMAVSTQVIEHVHNPGVYLSEINRVLTDDGELVISIPNIMSPFLIKRHFYRKTQENLISISKAINADYLKSRDHIQAWDAFHFVRLVSTVGFVLNEFRQVEGLHFPAPPFSKDKSYRYIEVKNERLKNFSYVLVFKFKKIKDVRIHPND